MEAFCVALFQKAFRKLINPLLHKRAMYDGDLDEDEQEELDNLRRLFRKET